jgi:hypothetical protein
MKGLGRGHSLVELCQEFPKSCPVVLAVPTNLFDKETRQVEVVCIRCGDRVSDSDILSVCSRLPPHMALGEGHLPLPWPFGSRKVCREFGFSGPWPSCCGPPLWPSSSPTRVTSSELTISIKLPHQKEHLDGAHTWQGWVRPGHWRGRERRRIGQNYRCLLKWAQLEGNWGYSSRGDLSLSSTAVTLTKPGWLEIEMHGIVWGVFLRRNRINLVAPLRLLQQNTRCKEFSRKPQGSLLF